MNLIDQQFRFMESVMAGEHRFGGTRPEAKPFGRRMPDGGSALAHRLERMADMLEAELDVGAFLLSTLSEKAMLRNLASALRDEAVAAELLPTTQPKSFWKRMWSHR